MTAEQYDAEIWSLIKQDRTLTARALAATAVEVYPADERLARWARVLAPAVVTVIPLSDDTGAKRPRGRPRADPPQVQLTVRLRQPERDALVRSAASTRRSLAQMAALYIEDGLRRDGMLPAEPDRS